MLSRGRIQEAYERIAVLVATPGTRILDIGCGMAAYRWPAPLVAQQSAWVRLRD